MANKYILVIDTLCQGFQPAWWDEDDRPVVYDTLREANLALAEEVEDLIERFREDPEQEEIESPDTHVVPCVVQEGGAVFDERGYVLYDPALGRP